MDNNNNNNNDKQDRLNIHQQPHQYQRQNSGQFANGNNLLTPTIKTVKYIFHLKRIDFN